MPPTEFITRAFVDVDGTNVECKEVDWTGSADGLEPVKVMNRKNRAVGYTEGNMVYEFTLTVPAPASGEEVDFHDLMAERTEFACTIEYDGGSTRVFARSRVSSVNPSSTSESGTDMTIECMALDMTKTPAN